MHTVEDREQIPHSENEMLALLWFKRKVTPTLSSWLVSSLFFALALSINFYRLGDPSLWFDEAFSVELARQPLPLLQSIIFGPEPNMELYYLLLHFWLGLTNLLGLLPTEFVVRLPSALFAAASSVVVFWFATHFLNRLTSLLGTTLYLVNYLGVMYAQQTRAYALQLLLICLSWYVLLYSLHASTKRTTASFISGWIAYVLITTTALYVHLFSALILGAQCFAFLGLVLFPNSWRSSARTCLRAFVTSLISVALLSLPLVAVALHGAKTDWLPVPHWHDFSYLLSSISGQNHSYLILWLCCCICGIGLCAWIWDRLYISTTVKPPQTQRIPRYFFLQFEDYDARLPIVWALCCWILVPVVASYIVSQGSLRLFSVRYLVVIIPALMLLIGFSVSMIRLRFIQVVLAALLIWQAVLALPNYYASAEIEDWRSTTFWLAQRYQAGDGLVCYDNDIMQGCQIPVEYYLHTFTPHISFDDDAPAVFSWRSYGTTGASARADEALDPHVLTNYAQKHSHLFFIVGRVPSAQAQERVEATQRWLDQHYKLLSSIDTDTVTVQLYRTA